MQQIIKRQIQPVIEKNLKKGFVVVLFGARRTGKTVLMNEIKKKLKTEDILHVQGEDLEVAEILSSSRLSILKQFLKGYKYLFIDEAQEIPHIGKNLKLIVDNIPDISVFITGSSAFNLHGETGEPLVGRSLFLKLYPFAVSELDEDFLQIKQSLSDKLIYGMYPQIITAESIAEKKSILESIKNGYLLKDILRSDNLKNSIFVIDLLRLIAFQIGHDISYSELATQLKVNVRTVQRYLDILEKTFVLFSVRGFSRNLRKEISKSPRYYFWDNGIRNVIIANFNDLKLRQDAGQLWENFCISERFKYLHNKGILANSYFWRTYDQQEIDLLEEREGKIFAYEFKFGNKKAKMPKIFASTYPNSEFVTINPDNFHGFLGI